MPPGQLGAVAPPRRLAREQVGLGAESSVVARDLDDVGAAASGGVWMYWLWESGLFDTASSW